MLTEISYFYRVICILKNMNPKKSLLLVLLFISLARFNLFAWTSSNEGVCYTMDTLTTLSPNITYNSSTGMYEVA